MILRVGVGSPFCVMDCVWFVCVGIGTITRNIADSLKYGPFYDGTTDGAIDATNIAKHVLCSENWVSMDQASPDIIAQVPTHTLEGLRVCSLCLCVSAREIMDSYHPIVSGWCVGGQWAGQLVGGSYALTSVFPWHGV